MKTLSATRFFIEKYLRLVVKESTSEIVALRKLKINPLNNSHCSKREINIEPKNKFRFAQVLGILGLILIFSGEFQVLNFCFFCFKTKEIN